MATSRTGTTRYKNNRTKALHQAQLNGQTNCPQCGIPLNYQQGRRPNSAETDHIIPHALGGTDHLENLRIICRRCNQHNGGKIGAHITNNRHKTHKNKTLHAKTSDIW